MRTERALAALRAADPADAETVAALLPTIDVAHVHALDVPEFVPAVQTPHSHSSGWHWVYPVAAVAAVLAVVVGVSVATREHHSRPEGAQPAPPSATPTSQAAGTTQNEQRKATAQAYLEQLVGSLRPHNGAPSPTRPEAVLDHPSSISMNENELDAVRWYTSPDSVADAVAWVKAHPPFGAKQTGTAETLGGPALRQEVDSVYFALDPGRDYVDGVGINVDATPHGDGSAIRIDAVGAWVPARTSGSPIPSISSVDIAIIRNGVGANPSAPTVLRTLAGAIPQRLADEINALPPYATGTYNCGAILAGTYRDDLEFHTLDGRTFAVQVRVGGCGGVAVTAAGRRPQQLAAGTVDEDVLSVLGLPLDYGMK